MNVRWIGKFLCPAACALVLTLGTGRAGAVDYNRWMCGEGGVVKGPALNNSIWYTAYCAMYSNDSAHTTTNYELDFPLQTDNETDFLTVTYNALGSGSSGHSQVQAQLIMMYVDGSAVVEVIN